MRPANAGLVLMVALLLSLARPAEAGPLYDPFLERFQVGALSDPTEMELAAGLPAGLLEPVKVDPNWWRAAWSLTDAEGLAPETRLSHRLLLKAKSPAEAGAWLARRQGLLVSLQPGAGIGAAADTEAHGYLRSERLARAFFESIRAGDLKRAREIAVRLQAESADLGLTDREVFVWHLRRLLLDKYLSERSEIEPDFWECLRDLGSYDASNAWAVWVAHRRALERPLLPPSLHDRQDGLFLGRLYKAWLGPEDLAASAFAPEFKAALGAGLLPRADLGRHFQRYPEPPTDFTLQGWWVRGRRMFLRGDAMGYEKLAARPDLKPGWTLDVWRRASERRLLKGQWGEGLQDLRQALDLVRSDSGTRSLRRRVRYWTEQALVLAIAQGDSSRAREILQQGTASFSGEAGEVFADETAYWRHVLSGGDRQTYVARDGNLLERAARAVEVGTVPMLSQTTDAAGEALRAAAERPLWDLWFKWGRALASVDGIPADRQSRADAYLARMMDGASRSTDKTKIDAVLTAVAERFHDRPELETLLDVALARDIQRASYCLTPPSPSAVPALLKELRSSQLDRHALLGFSLVTGDLRGILAAATALPGTGLALNEKLLFLYPLPPDGALRRALQESGNEAALLLAVARNESLFEPAVRSRAGALGWMQIMPFHYEQRGALPGAENWRCPAVSVATGDGLLTENRRRFAGDPYLTLAAYNAGPGAAKRWREQLGGKATADVYLAWIGYTETRRYVEKVLIDRFIYDWIINAPHSSPAASD